MVQYCMSGIKLFVIFRESQYLVGFVLRRDLLLATENAKDRLESVPGNSLCVFTQHVPVVGQGPPPIKLRKVRNCNQKVPRPQVGPASERQQPTTCLISRSAHKMQPVAAGSWFS